MYKKVFNVNNPFWRSMGSVFDLFILNILWIVCSIPIFTFGAATAAANYALIQKARGEDTAIHKDFFKSFKTNFKQGIPVGLITILIGAFLGFDIYLCRINGTGVFSFFIFFFGVFFIIWAMTALYVFPILAKFERKTKEIFIWAFTMALRHLPSTLLMLVLIGFGLYLCYRLPGLIFIMFGLLFQFCSVMFASMFKPFLPEPEHFGEDPEMYDYNPKSEFTINGADNNNEAAADEYTISADEAAMYGCTPEEMEALLHDESQPSATHEE